MVLAEFKKEEKIKMQRNRKGVSTVLLTVVLVIIAVVASLVGVYYWKVLTTPPGPSVPFYGTAQLKVTAQNVFDKTDITETSPTYKAFNTKGKDLESMVKADFAGGASLTADTATDVNILPEDQGNLVIWAYAGTAHFLDAEATKIANDPRIKDVKTDLDVNADGKKDTLLALSVGDLGEPGQATKPSLELNLQLLPDESASLTINSPADKTTGTGTQTGTIEWQITTFAEKKGWALARVYVVQNRTDEDYVKVTGITVGYDVGTFTGSDITYETGAKRWSFNIGVSDYRTVQEAKLIARPVSGTSYCSFTIAFESYFASGNSGVTLTIYIDEISPAGTITTDSDAVIAKIS